MLLWGDNCAEWVGAFFGCMLRGAVAVPMDRIAIFPWPPLEAPNDAPPNASRIGQVISQLNVGEFQPDSFPVQVKKDVSLACFEASKASRLHPQLPAPYSP